MNVSPALINAIRAALDQHFASTEDLEDAIEVLETSLADDPYADQVVALPQGYIHGLELSNNGSDATNDIDIAAGMCRNSTNTTNLVRTASITKRLDAAWAVGSGNGGRDTGAIANTTYHVHVIRRSDTGVVDALFSTSATAPTMPADYDSFRRVGAILRESAAIVLFTQYGDTFKRTALATGNSNTVDNPTRTLTTLSGIPTGVAVQPIMQGITSVAGAGTFSGEVGETDTGNTSFIWEMQNTAAGDRLRWYLPSGLFTNTSGQIYIKGDVATTTLTNNIIFINGWIDQR